MEELWKLGIIIKKWKMPWYMNFCAPYIPNDPTINFHRYAQASLLALYTLAYAALHLYYKFCAPAPASAQPEEAKPPANNEKESEAESIDSSEVASEKSKVVSIKVDEQANDSCLGLKKTGASWDNSTIKKEGGSQVEHVTLEQLEGHFPIVFGHFAVAMGLSIMYTPYAEQSIACLLYMLLTIPLVLVNARRFEKWTRFFWILMASLLVFIFTCGLLEVGQANWDFINLTCFATEYVSLYD